MEYARCKRIRVELPNLGNAYVLAAVMDDRDYFQITLPGENWAEHEKWRVAFDRISMEINEEVKSLHEYYQGVISGLSKKTHGQQMPTETERTKED